MTYAYDDYIQMPTKDLYDTAVMKMAIDAAKDMYDKGQAQMENFYKTYGDFMSPFAKDMQKYGEAMNYVRDTVNDAYARGIDLARSPEGRAMIQRLTHSVNPLWYNTARQNAKVGYAYLDSLKEAMRNGTYDKAYEDFLLEESGLGPFSEFSSDGGRIWDRSGVSKYQDINQWTHHLFDNMELTYDPKLSESYPGFMAYSKNKDTMHKIAANAMASLANSDMGRFMIDKLTNQFKAVGLSDKDALEKATATLENLIVNSNYEESQVKLIEDPYKKIDYEYTKKSEQSAKTHEQRMEELYGPNYKEDAENGTLSYHGKTGNGNTPNINTSWTMRQRDAISKNMNGVAQYINNLQKGFTAQGAKEILQAKGVINPTKDQIANQVKESKQEFNKLITGPLTKDKIELLSEYYSAYQTVPAGEDLLTALAIAANYSPEEKINSVDDIKRRPVTFTSNEKNMLLLTRQSQAMYLGMPLTSGSASSQLLKYLTKNGVSGYIPYNDVSINRMPYGQDSSLDFNITVRVKKSDLDEFRIKKGDKEFNKIMSLIGAKYIEKQAKVIAPTDSENPVYKDENKGKLVWDNVEYIDIPCTRHVSSNSQIDRQIDKYHISSTQTKASSAKQEGVIYNPNNPMYSIINNSTDYE